MKADNPSQSAAFIKKAREVGADESQSAADQLLDALRHRPPEPHDAMKKKPRPALKK
jgi:hypothetical protein